MEMIIMVLKWSSLHLFCGILAGMVHVVDILIKISMLASFADALTAVFDEITVYLDNVCKFECKL